MHTNTGTNMEVPCVVSKNPVDIKTLILDSNVKGIVAEKMKEAAKK